MDEAENGDEGTQPRQRPAEPMTEAAPSPEASGDIQSYIGARLRQAFDDVAKQPIPDRFLQLMAELDRS